MLNRLTPEAKSVVAQAYECALRDRTREIREEHLLEALQASPDGGRLLGGVADDGERAQIRAEIEQARRRAGVTATEAGALAEFGIDLDAVVLQVENKLGSGALLAGSKRASRWRGPVLSATVIHVFEEAERHLRVTGGRSLRVEHLVLGVLSAPSVVAESLARRGLTVAEVSAAIVDAGQESAAR